MSAWQAVMRVRCPKDTDPARRIEHLAYDVRLPLLATATATVLNRLCRCACGAELVFADEGDPR